MKKLFYLLITIFGFIVCPFDSINAQGVGINTTGSAADPSAILDVNSSSSHYLGMLIPRMSTAGRNTITNPAVGLQVFNTDCGVNEYYTGSCWIALAQVLKRPDAITCSGTTYFCAGETRTFIISPVAGATSYQWTVPAGASITSGQGTTSVTVVFDQLSGAVCVSAGNSCETSADRCMNIDIKMALPVVGNIIGTPSVCANAASVVYSISPVSGATAYNWTVPSGATITGGQNTPSITVTLGSSSGNVAVTATNGCGTSPASTFPVTVNAVPSSTFTPLSSQINTAVTFSPTFSGGAYSWTFIGGSISASAVQNPSVTWSSAGSYNVSLSVTANGCSSSTTTQVIITAPVVQTFSYTGSQQTFTVPSGITSVFIEAWGAAGGDGYDGGNLPNTGGKGGYVYGLKAVTPSSVLYINVGGKGNNATSSNNNFGGWNGGGKGGYYGGGAINGGGGGGGASDVRLGGTTLTDRIIVGGAGGGGSDFPSVGGYGGYTDGSDGSGGASSNNWGHGGTQTAGGAAGLANGSLGADAAPGTLGIGGAGGVGGCGGGGGAGYYGGGGGAACHSGSGGGGSSYVGGMTSGTTGSTNNTRSGDGQVVITY